MRRDLVGAHTKRRARRHSNAAVLATVLTLAPLLTGINARAGELGANKFDLLMQYVLLGPEGNVLEGYRTIRQRMAQKAIGDAHDVGLRFFRVAATGFRPVKVRDHENDLMLWQSDPGQFWGLVDRMFDDLDEAGIRLVPTFLWQPAQFAALAGDKVQSFFRDPDCPSRRLFDKYVGEFIERYKSRKTILFYELSNELNLEVDLDLSAKCRFEPQDCVADRFTTSEMLAFSRDFVRLVKSIDPGRPVTSGYSLPRPAAAHLARRPEFGPGGPDWTPDTPDEFRRHLVKVHDPFDIVEVHIYPAEGDRFGRPAGEAHKLLADTADIARSIGKPLFLGEFGETVHTPAMEPFLDTIVRENIAYSAVWIWEYYQFKTYETRNTPASAYSVEPGYSTDLIASLIDTERRMGGGPPHRAKDTSPRVIVVWPLPCANVNTSTKITAVASDGSLAVSKVEFLVNGLQLGTTSAPPHQVIFDPIGLSPHVATVVARATNTLGIAAEFTTNINVNGAAGRCNT